MLSALLRTGLLDTTFLATAAVLAWTLFCPRKRIPPWAVTTGLAVMALGTAADLGMGLYRGYAIPRDVMQDIVAAREFDAGRPMHPTDMTELIGTMLAEEGKRPSLLYWSPSLAAREKEQYELMLREHWVQAHPPGMSLLTVPFVRAFGVLGTQVAFALIGMVALAVTLWLLHRELIPHIRGPILIAIALGVIGWDPVVSVLRAQQPGLLLVVLTTVAWAGLRRGEAARPGVLVAIAATLKLLPALLLVPLVAQHRRAFAVALLALAILSLGILAVVPWTDIVDYRSTADGVVEEYAAFPGNISLHGAFARIARAAGWSAGTAKIAWGISGSLLVAGLFWRVARAERYPVETDRGIALSLALLPLLSPVAWDHYLVFLLLPLAVLGRWVFASSSRRCRIGYWALLTAFAVPDHTHLWLFEIVRASGIPVLEVGFVELFRTGLVLALVAWLFVARPTVTMINTHFPVGQP